MQNEKQILDPLGSTTQITKEEVAEAVVEAEKEIKAQEVKATSNTTTVKLPSNGLMNPNITEVTLKRMSALQSKTLFTSNDPNYLTTLIMDCIVEPANITTKDLHPHDIVYLIFILRHISSPKNITENWRCDNPRCLKEFTTQVKVPELKVNYANVGSYNMSITLPDCGDTLQFQILSEGDITNCDKIADRQIRQFNIDDEAWHKLISKLAYMIVTKNDLEFKDFKEKVDYLESLSAYDFDTFNQAYNDIISSFGLERKYIDTCPHCSEPVEVEAYIAPEFFRLV